MYPEANPDPSLQQLSDFNKSSVRFGLAYLITCSILQSSSSRVRPVSAASEVSQWQTVFSTLVEAPAVFCSEFGCRNNSAAATGKRHVEANGESGYESGAQGALAGHGAASCRMPPALRS